MKQKSIKALNRLDVESYRALLKNPIVLVLDNVRSALNVGSAFRTADGFALEGIALCGITAQPPHREITKTAIGATESVAWSYHKTTEAALVKLREEGFRLYAVEQTDRSISLEKFKLDPTEKIGLVLGNEVKGVSPAALKHCDGAIEVPQFGTKHSFNVSVCTGIVCWELIRQLSAQRG